MNKKFIKENKPLVREFLGSLITKIVTGRAPAKFQKALDNDPVIQKQKDQLKKIEKQMLDKIKKGYETNPKFKELMDKYNIQIN
jgi:hypothetical protein